MQHDAVDDIVHTHFSRRLVHCRSEDASHLALHRQNIGNIRRAPAHHVRHSRKAERIEPIEQRTRAIAMHRDGLDYRHAEFLLEPGAIDADTAAMRDVGHVERDHYGQTQAFGFDHQAKIELEIGGVGDTDY